VKKFFNVNNRFLYDRYGKRKFGDKVQNELDEEVIKMLNEQMEVAKSILVEKRDIVEKMVKRLLEKKTLMFRDIYEILGDRPFEPPQNFKRYLGNG
jgi:cell division protease FtsH